MLHHNGGSCGAALSLIGGPAGQRVLDATCGLGRKTLVFSHLGCEVAGSDASAYAVARARELAASEGRSVEFVASAWSDLPGNVSEAFDLVFVDAFMDCLEDYDGLVASLKGIYGVLAEGGVFVSPGPHKGEEMAVLLAGDWQASDRFYLAWQHTEEDCTCTCVVSRDRGEDYVDENHLYVVNAIGASPHLESATLRRYFRWEWEQIEGAALSAGFSALETIAFTGYSFSGSDFSRMVAKK
jgi:SAM-dependent methyltransferase